ncbi:tRNA dihydrouridine synthase DusB [Aureimonas psammosilenae]|uniref:tRNA dihydrouridine synthase DusB n=1 Tax=Aureimonas psammosilenae TaxID=2495496 RepID=UPI001F36C151|nr:tRNA dihydrouridine synthase DusB [Aureimonas psammosilenae]
MPIDIGGIRLRNRAFLAPLSGISDVPFRRIVRGFGAGVVVSEMVASAELVRGHPESALRAKADGDGPHVVQLAGRDPVWMRAAAERLAADGVDIIDINMGCPAKKVVGGLSGSALMREPELALRIVEATVEGAGSVPVTLKMRLGWDEATINAPEIAAKAEAAGVRMITVHGRTRMQFYSGRADWRAIRAVKNAVGVPVVANGDLVASDRVNTMLSASQADAVMIGRGAQGRPWFPALVAGAIQAHDLRTVRLASLIAAHYEAILDHYGVQVGSRAARKHLGWYLDGMVDVTSHSLVPDRARMLASDSPKAVLAMIADIFGDLSAADVEFAPRRETAEAA